MRNNLGSDYIVFALVVQGKAVNFFFLLPRINTILRCSVPPTPPLLLVTAVTSESVQLQWKQGDNGGAAVRGFILSYRKEIGEWEELTLEQRTTTYLMEGLHCGTSYQFRLTGK